MPTITGCSCGGDNIEGDYPAVADGINGVVTVGSVLSVIRQSETEVCIIADKTIGSVELYNTSGALISVSKPLGSNEIVLTLPHCGVYVAKLRLADGSIKVVKI